jgi:hypothetical protein
MEEKNTLSFRARLLLGILAVAFVSLAIFFAGSAVFAVRMAEKNYARTVTDPMTSHSPRSASAPGDTHNLGKHYNSSPYEKPPSAYVADGGFLVLKAKRYSAYHADSSACR